MPYAVVRVEDRHREALTQIGVLPIRRAFEDMARGLVGHKVVLYQSARQAERSNLALGYFATAYVQNVVPDPKSRDRCLLMLEDIDPLTLPRRMIENGGFSEGDLINVDGLLKGWKASEDIREISEAQFLALTGLVLDSPFVDPAAADLPIPRFSPHWRQIRDAQFRARVYQAYRGRCAVSGVSLLWPNGNCSLIAAHIYPFAKRAYNSVSAGILLAPTWHERFDAGNLIIDEDYQWSVTAEDEETIMFSKRRLILPANEDERPDLELLRMKRALFPRF